MKRLSTRITPIAVVRAVLLAGLLAGCTTALKPTAFRDASELPSQEALPDPLVMASGRRVTTRAQWVNERRPELMTQFQHYMYGAIPPKPGFMKAKTGPSTAIFWTAKQRSRLSRSKPDLKVHR